MILQQRFNKVLIFTETDGFKWIAHGNITAINIGKPLKYDEIRTNLHLVMKRDMLNIVTTQGIVVASFGC